MLTMTILNEKRSGNTQASLSKMSWTGSPVSVQLGLFAVMGFLLVACVEPQLQNVDSKKSGEAPEQTVSSVHSTNPPAATAPSIEASANVGAENGMAIKRPAAASLAGRSSWEAYLASLAKADRELLEHINTNYLGALEFASLEEFEDLKQKGFPTPEEWIEAARMSDSDLETRADAGSAKAQLLYADRMASRLAEHQAAVSGVSRGVDVGIERYRTHAVMHANMGVAQSNTVFAAYVWGRVESTSTGRIEPLVAAIMYAGGLGDSRSVAYLEQVRAGREDINLSIVQMRYNSLAAAGRRAGR